MRILKGLLIGLGGLFILMIAIAFLSDYIPSGGAGQDKPIDPEFKKAALQLIQVALNDGSLMKMDPEHHNAQVKPEFWRGIPYEHKKVFLYSLAIAMEEKNGLRYVRLRDGFTGKLVGIFSGSQVTIEP
ncbi:MAG TPA: hypothetical protein VGK94_08020 [Candidatus Polarisedimenticolia bacterium]|jgi:hypothetical protein